MAPRDDRRRKAERRPAASTAGASPTVVLGKWLQQRGYAVGEHPAFGGVTVQHSSTGGHHTAEAIDINRDDGDEPAALDNLMRILEPQKAALGIELLLWRVADHFDHMHITIRNATGVTPALAKLVGLDAAGLAKAMGAEPKTTAEFATDTGLDLAGKVAAAIVGMIFDLFGENGARMLLYIALVLGGGVLALYGVSHALGVKGPGPLPGKPRLA